MSAYFVVHGAKSKSLAFNKCPSGLYGKHDSVLFPLGYMSLVLLEMATSLPK